MADRLHTLEKAFRRHPEAPLFARLAEAYLRRGMVFRALEVCEKGCERFPDYTTGFQVLSHCYEAHGDLDRARRAMSRALRLDPENPAGYRRLSQLHRRLGNPQLALRSLRQALRLDPLDAGLLDELSQLAHTVWTESQQQVEDTYDLLPSEVGETQSPRVAEEMGGQPCAGDVPAEDAPVGEAPEADTLVDEPVEVTLEAEAVVGEAVVDEPIEAEPADDAVARVPAPGGAIAGEPVFAMPTDGAPDPSQTAADAPPANVEEIAAQADAGQHEDLAEAPSSAAADAAGPADARSALQAGEPVAEVTISLGLREDAELGRLLQEIDSQQAQAQAVQALPEPAADGDGAQAPPAAQVAEAIPRIMTVTLARIYSLQGLGQRAIEVYRQVLERDPDNQAASEELAALEGKLQGHE